MEYWESLWLACIVQLVTEPTKLHNTHANHNDSHFMQYYFATEKESLLNEKSNYELYRIVVTYTEYLQLQSYVVDCSQRSTSSISATSDYNVLVKSPQYVTVTSSQNIHTLDYYSEAAADGSATVDQSQQRLPNIICLK